jgi:hypothetical protein
MTRSGGDRAVRIVGEARDDVEMDCRRIAERAKIDFLRAMCGCWGEGNPPRLYPTMNLPMPTSFEELCAMMDYRSLSHWLARPMSAATLAQLTPTERLERTRAQKILSQRKWRGRAEQFFTTDVQPPTYRAPHRDWLALEDCSRDIIRP